MLTIEQIRKVSRLMSQTDTQSPSGTVMGSGKLSVIIDGVIYVPACVPELQPEITKTDRRLYMLLDQLRSAICKYRDDTSSPRLQSDIDELDRMAGMANRAIGIVINPKESGSE